MVGQAVDNVIISATITSAPTVPAIVGTHVYFGSVQFPDGKRDGFRIGPSAISPWRGVNVRPLEVGTKIMGILTNGVEIQWYYMEIADFGPC